VNIKFDESGEIELLESCENLAGKSLSTSWVLIYFCLAGALKISNSCQFQFLPQAGGAKK
jgi:hypothetical protein